MSDNLLDKSVLKAKDAVKQDFEWGQLNWFVNQEIGNSRNLTLGKCLIKPGHENPRHHHPNCEEILQLTDGKILHSVGDKQIEMNPGDTIVIPPNVVHNARNIGKTDAVMTIIFSTANRLTEGEL